MRTQPKRKRGSVIAAYENASIEVIRTPTPSHTSANASASGRPRRTTASSRSLNLDDLSAQSFSQGEDTNNSPNEGMDIDAAAPLC